MAIPTSVGGDVVIDDTDLSVSRHNLRAGSVSALVSTTAAGGTLFAGVRQDNSAQISVPWDSVEYPTALGLEPMAVIDTLVMKIGGSTKCNILSGGMVETVQYGNDPNADVPRVDVDIKGGTVQLDHSIPT